MTNLINRVLSMGIVFAAATGMVGSAQAQEEDGSPRSQMISTLQAECDAFAEAGDSRVDDCLEALHDMRRSTSPVVVARILEQYRAGSDPEMSEAAQQAFSMFDSQEDADLEWMPYGNERAE